MSSTPHGLLHQFPIMLRPDPARTVVRPFLPDDPAAYADPAHSRTARIAERVLSLTDAEVRDALAAVPGSLDSRHRQFEALLLRRFEEIDISPVDRNVISEPQAMLIGAYFSEEYSFEAAALFNPSIVPHPDQTGVADDAIRFILSLRGIGEGHVSSTTFRTGIWGPDDLVVDPPSPGAVPPLVDRSAFSGDRPVLRMTSDDARDISELVFFPMTPEQYRGFEDLRLTKFTEDDGGVSYAGTFTAFSGGDVHTHLLTTEDFKAFEVRPTRGSAAATKGMALFPRRIGGRYAMLGRQDNENIWLLTSDDLATWDGGEIIVRPRWPWEFIQMGNCGSPIEIDEGWLVLTHGVGTVRNYAMGACLLDKDDPRKLLARMTQPLIEPGETERDGYVPNVVYSCGALLKGRDLLIPYGAADNFAAFASVSIDDLLRTMDAP